MSTADEMTMLKVEVARKMTVARVTKAARRTRGVRGEGCKGTEDKKAQKKKKKKKGNRGNGEKKGPFREEPLDLSSLFFLSIHSDQGQARRTVSTRIRIGTAVNSTSQLPLFPLYSFLHLFASRKNRSPVCSSCSSAIMIIFTRIHSNCKASLVVARDFFFPSTRTVY